MDKGAGAVIGRGDTVTHGDANSLEFQVADIIALRETVAPHGAHREVRHCASLRHQEVAQLHALASAVGRLSPSHRDPEAFHIGKSEIVAELRRLARNIAGR